MYGGKTYGVKTGKTWGIMFSKGALIHNYSLGIFKIDKCELKIKRILEFLQYLLCSNFITISFGIFVENEKKCFFQLLDCVPLVQSKNK